MSKPQYACQWLQWLLIEWPAEEPGPTKYWLSTLPEQTPHGEAGPLAPLGAADLRQDRGQKGQQAVFGIAEFTRCHRTRIRGSVLDSSYLTE